MLLIVFGVSDSYEISDHGVVWFRKEWKQRLKLREEKQEKGKRRLLLLTMYVLQALYLSKHYCSFGILDEPA